MTIDVSGQNQTALAERLGEIVAALGTIGYRHFVKWRTYGRVVDPENERVADRIRSEFSAPIAGFGKTQVTELQGIPVSVAEVILPFTEAHISHLVDASRCILVVHNQGEARPEELLPVFSPFVLDLHECAFEVALERRPALFLMRFVETDDDSSTIAQVIAHRWLAARAFDIRNASDSASS